MRRIQPFVPISAAVLLSFVISVFIYRGLRQNTEPTRGEAAPVQSLVVASSDLPWGTKLSEEMLKLVPFPRDSLPERSFSDHRALRDRILIASIKMNEPILESKLAPLTVEAGGLAAVTHPEKRAMAVKVDEVVGVAGFIQPSNRVDVLVTLNLSPPVTKTVLQNVLVLASGMDVDRKGKEERAVVVRVITLEVSPEEAEKLALASTEGKLRLALRNHIAVEPVLTKGATLSSLLESYRLPEESRAAEKERPKDRSAGPPPVVSRPPRAIEVIKGSTISTVTFE